MTIALAALRTLVGLAFVATGVAILALFGTSVADFARWGFPLSGVVAVLVAAVDIVVILRRKRRG